MKVKPLEFEKPIVELEKQLDELKKHSKLSAIDLERETRAMEK
jgi:acetyl-CoA carboxylase alpha subunit